MSQAPSPAASVASAIHDGRIHVLLAASGSIATIKLPLIISALQRHSNVRIRVILTKTAAQFLAGQSPEQPTVESLAALPNVEGVHQDEDEWVESGARGAQILHINLRRWAHILVIAPLSANTLAKIVHGMSDNLLLDTVRCWDTTGLIDGKKARIVVAPSMNTAMWFHPITAQQIRVLEEDWGVGNDVDDAGDKDGPAGRGWFEVLRPMEKRLACNDVGLGAMMEWSEIVKVIEQRLGLS
ncbi:flavo protein [Sodiomyces alkalinus F11]|uniref:Flavo protein n=1 Tax=Sodiomyces alkalinus (strain CBS 110278 / VKM F-3762 / F11) TaxID=1314773 RepID=A0A3N2Q7H7_SODAK|nr:flavo protein [Sodiomyces alkalinus F11]ROT42618.1 flavo protein [Sodiomyces alkalinus F11]